MKAVIEGPIVTREILVEIQLLTLILASVLLAFLLL